MGIGFYRLHKAINSRRMIFWEPSYLTNRHVGWTVAATFIGMNIVILIQGARSVSIIPGYWWLIIIMIICFSSFLYWSVLRLLQNPSLSSKVGLEVTIHKVGGSEEFPPEMKDAMRIAKDDGSWRRVQYTVYPGAYTVVLDIANFSIGIWTDEMGY